MRDFSGLRVVAVCVLALGAACLGCRPSDSSGGKGPKSTEPSSGKRAAAPGVKPSPDSEPVKRDKPSPGKNSTKDADAPSPVKAASDKASKAAGAARAPEPAKPAGPPKVVLGEQIAATCLVKVGDALPDASLPDLDGKPQAVRSPAKPKYTVVLFWTPSNMYAVAALRYLAEDVAPAYQAKGVNLLGVCVKDKAEDAKKAATEAGAKFPILVDADGSYYAKVAKVAADDKRPRIYLLDSAGKIAWLDTEFSETTKNQLQAWLDFDPAAK